VDVIPNSHSIHGALYLQYLFNLKSESLPIHFQRTPQFLEILAPISTRCINPLLISLNYRLAIFDSDGTLADTLPWMRNIFNELADEHGFRRVPPHEREKFRDLHGPALLRELGLPLWKLPRVVASMRRRMAAHTGSFSLFPGTPEALHLLSATGVTLAIASSNSRENVERVLGPSTSQLITHWACGISIFGKSRKLTQILRASRIHQSHAIYIGDEVRDAEAAAQAGIAFGAVTWGQHSEKMLSTHNPALVFHSIDEIPKLC
jgi:phosphoglycolate phosphatase